MAHKSSGRHVSPKTTFSAAGDHTYTGSEKVAGIRTVTCCSLLCLWLPRQWLHSSVRVIPETRIHNSGGS